MKVKDLVEKLEQYNPEAEMNAIADNKRWSFTLAYGNSEGCKKENCETVSIYVDDLNKSESVG